MEVTLATQPPAPSKSVSSNVAKVAFAFGQFLPLLPCHQPYVFEVCKAVYQIMPEARAILARCEKLKGCTQGGTYIIVLDV